MFVHSEYDYILSEKRQGTGLNYGLSIRTGWREVVAGRTYIQFQNADTKKIRLHRLKYEAFIGPAGDKVVHHRNGISTDNRITNLGLKENAKHVSDHLKGSPQMAAAVEACRKFYQAGVTPKNIAFLLDIPVKKVYRYIHGNMSCVDGKGNGK
jgi:hypothetical protein